MVHDRNSNPCRRVGDVPSFGAELERLASPRSTLANKVGFMKMTRAKPLRLLLITMIAISCVSSIAQGNTDSTLTAQPLETHRATKRKGGMRVGLIAGAVAGTGLFLLGALAAESLCEYECSDIHPVGYVAIGALGAAVGAATGAVVGGLFGSMIPDDKRTMSQPHEPGIMKRPIASVAIEPGVGVTTERPENESGFLLRATLIAQLKPWLGVGPEITYADLAGGTYGFRGAFYFGPREPNLRPYVVTALGWQHWKTGAFDTDVDVLGWGMGGGLAWTPGSPNTHIGLEARYEFSPQNIDQNQYFRFVSTSAVLRHSW